MSALISIFAADILIILTILTRRRLRLFFSSLLLSAAIYGFVAFTFRQIRNLFPKPHDEIMVGFAQYFGYPIFFDTILFVGLLLTPIVTYLLIEKINVK